MQTIQAMTTAEKFVQPILEMNELNRLRVECAKLRAENDQLRAELEEAKAERDKTEAWWSKLFFDECDEKGEAMQEVERLSWAVDDLEARNRRLMSDMMRLRMMGWC